MNVATEILKQLGGNKFLAMTGSKNFVFDEKNASLSMHLTTNKAKAKYLHIELKGNDTYTMTFRGKKGFEFPVVAEYSNVYSDKMQTVFKSVTGLDTSL